MSLKRIGHAANETLEDFYVKCGFSQMVEFVKSLDRKLGSRKVFCLTSVNDLVLLSEPDHLSPWRVFISPQDPVPGIQVSYWMPASLAPWQGARVTGLADNVEDAVEMTILSMAHSGGWAEQGLQGRRA